MGSAIINFIINGAIAWAIYRPMAAVPIWGERSIAGDTFSTAFLLPFFVCLIVTPLTHRKVRRGEIPALCWRRVSHPVLGRLPSSAILRALVFGIFCAISVASFTVFALGALGVNEMALLPFLTFKSTFAAILAGVVAPISARFALGDSCVSEP